MQNYELLFVLPGTLSEDEVPALVSKVKEVLTESGIESVDVKDMGKSRLAYPMKHIRYGYFHLVRFEAEGKSVETLKAKLKHIPELLRHLLTKYDPNNSGDAKISFGNATGSFSRGDEPRSRDRQVPTSAANVAANVKISTPKTEEKNTVEEKVVTKKESSSSAKDKDSKKVKLDDIDKKLDEILYFELDKV